jgi:hypothetical protein
VDNLILLFEDEPNDAFFFEYSLREAGIVNRLRVIRGGSEAIDYL